MDTIDELFNKLRQAGHFQNCSGEWEKDKIKSLINNKCKEQRKNCSLSVHADDINSGIIAKRVLNAPEPKFD